MPWYIPTTYFENTGAFRRLTTYLVVKQSDEFTASAIFHIPSIDKENGYRDPWKIEGIGASKRDAIRNLRQNAQKVTEDLRYERWAFG